MELSVTARYDDGPAVVEVSGALDAFTAPFLGDYLELVRRAAGPRLVLRLGDLSFVDCAGLRTLLAARDECTSGGGWLRLHDVPVGARRVMALTGTDALLYDVEATRLQGAGRVAGG